jgi:hypothetical protein
MIIGKDKGISNQQPGACSDILGPIEKRSNSLYVRDSRIITCRNPYGGGIGRRSITDAQGNGQR